jgi:ubiquinone biosynthesis protein Coq4
MLSYSKSHLSNYHHRFNKYWHKLEKEQQALPLVETGRDLKQQLQELIAKKLEEESENDVTRLRVRLQAILRSM